MKSSLAFASLLVLAGSCLQSSAQADDFHVRCGKVAKVGSSGGRIGIHLQSPTQGRTIVDVFIGGNKRDYMKATRTLESEMASLRILTQAQGAMAAGKQLCIGSETAPVRQGEDTVLTVYGFDSTSIED